MLVSLLSCALCFGIWRLSERQGYELEVMVVVVCVTEVHAGVAGHIRCGRHNSTPGSLVDERESLGVGCESREGFLEIRQTGLGKCLVADEIVECVDDLSKFCECLFSHVRF